MESFKQYIEESTEAETTLPPAGHKVWYRGDATNFPAFDTERASENSTVGAAFLRGGSGFYFLNNFNSGVGGKWAGRPVTRKFYIGGNILDGGAGWGVATEARLRIAGLEWEELHPEFRKHLESGEVTKAKWSGWSTTSRAMRVSELRSPGMWQQLSTLGWTGATSRWQGEDDMSTLLVFPDAAGTIIIPQDTEVDPKTLKPKIFNNTKSDMRSP
tara:strand:- start:121 stop:765 length:645 start_codon:yes stop_codon:yes gene_type:complete